MMQHQARFNNSEQSAHRHTQGLHPKSAGMGDAAQMSQSTYAKCFVEFRRAFLSSVFTTYIPITFYKYELKYWMFNTQV
jgi:hypothetical protein